MFCGFPPEADGTREANAMLERLPAARMSARANTAGHMHALARAGVAIAMLDCYAGDADPALVRVGAPALIDQLRAVVHVDMHKNARVRAVLDFLGELVAAEQARLDGVAADQNPAAASAGQRSST